MTIHLRPIAVVLLFATSLAAQLSGTYTIDSSQPASPTNFTSFQAAAGVLQGQGVSGYTEFVVSPGNGPYQGFSLGVIQGTSATSRVRFSAAPGTRPIISGPPSLSASPAVQLGTGFVSLGGAGTGPSHLVFDGFEVTGAPAGAAIQVVGGSFITIRNCIAHNCGSGIALVVTHDSHVQDCEVYGTTHSLGFGASDAFYGAITVFFHSLRNTVSRNRVHDCVGDGILLSASLPENAVKDNVVINNMVWNCSTQLSQTFTGGIACRMAENSVIANNTISMSASSNHACLSIMGAYPGSVLLPREVSNNILQHLGGGACFRSDYSGAIASTRQDHNLYDPAGGGPIAVTSTAVSGPSITTLAEWRAATGAEANSTTGPSGFVSPTDLHLTPASGALNAGISLPEVLRDIDGTARPVGGPADVGADEFSSLGLFAAFTAGVTSGTPGLSVSFVDRSYSSAAGGITSWAWDVDNDGTSDYFTPNPTHVFSCPGSYSVTLTVTDGVNPANTVTQTNLILVTHDLLAVSTTGVGDLVVTPVPSSCYPTATHGFTLVSLDTAGPVGGGSILGLYPDSLTSFCIASPAAVGNVLHFVPNGVSYPDAPLVYPAGTLTPWIGLTMDWVQVFADPNWQTVHVSNIVRVTY